MSKKILIVDDSGTVRQQVRLALTQGGFDVVEAGDGIEATEKLGQNADVAAMVCDVNMPRMNGIELLEKLAKDGRSIPTVMLTTEGQPDLIQRAKAAGAKGWIVKPFKADLLVAAIRKLSAA